MNDRQYLDAELLSMRRRVRRLTATNLLLAVVLLAFGGAGAAYALAAANSVNSASIIDGSVKHADVKENSLGSSRFLDNSVTGGKITDNGVTGADVDETSLALPEGNFADGDKAFHPGTYIAHVTANAKSATGKDNAECRPSVQNISGIAFSSPVNVDLVANQDTQVVGWIRFTVAPGQFGGPATMFCGPGVDIGPSYTSVIRLGKLLPLAPTGLG